MKEKKSCFFLKKNTSLFWVKKKNKTPTKPTDQSEKKLFGIFNLPDFFS